MPKTTRNTQHGGKRPGAGPKITNLKLTVPEAMLIIDCLNGTFVEPSTARQQIPFEIADGIRLEHLDQKWSVDGPALLAKLEKLTDESAVALAEAVNKWWETDGKTDREKTRKAGLTQ